MEVIVDTGRILIYCFVSVTVGLLKKLQTYLAEIFWRRFDFASLRGE